MVSKITGLDFHHLPHLLHHCFRNHIRLHEGGAYSFRWICPWASWSSHWNNCGHQPASSHAAAPSRICSPTPRICPTSTGLCSTSPGLCFTSPGLCSTSPRLCPATSGLSCPTSSLCPATSHSAWIQLLNTRNVNV